MQLLDDGGKRHVFEHDEFVTSVDLPAAWVEPRIARGVSDKRVVAETDRQRVARGVPDKTIALTLGGSAATVLKRPPRFQHGSMVSIVHQFRRELRAVEVA